MRKSVLPIVLGMVLSIGAVAQEKEGVKREGAHQSEYNSDAQDRDHSAEIDSGVQPSEDGDNENSDPGNQVHDAASAANTPGTDTRTVSSAGSPGILMSDGEKPDGTNTMQRASLNIAGSPIPGSAGTGEKVNADDRSPNRVFKGEKQKRVPGTSFTNTPPDSKDKKKK